MKKFELNPKYSKQAYAKAGFAAVASNGKAVIIGDVDEGEKYSVLEGNEVIFSETLEGLKAVLTKRKIVF
jgi:hypothetical protein